MVKSTKYNDNIYLIKRFIRQEKELRRILKSKNLIKQKKGERDGYQKVEEESKKAVKSTHDNVTTRIRMKKTLYAQLMHLKNKIQPDLSTNQLIEFLYDDYMNNPTSIQTNSISTTNDVALNKIDSKFFLSEQYFSMLFEGLYC
ncbi:Uncharacterized protein QTN25_004994 [Entamoeba marina]